VARATPEERAFWVRTIEKGDQGAGDLQEALRLLDRHGALETTRADALTWAAKARDVLGGLPDHPLREMLDDLASYVVERIN
jgi:octaprenyl-diphosphate synthase